MPTVPTPRRRTINMPAVRSKQIALAAAQMGLTSEQTIQSFITAGLLTLATHDPAFRYALMRTAGADWGELESADPAEMLSRVMP